MFIYFSNKLELLKDMLAKIIGDRSSCDPLRSETVLVQNDYVAKWMQLELSMKFGIIANIVFTDINNFFWNIYEKIILSFFSVNYFSRTMMVWKLMEIIPSLSKRNDFKVIQDYLSNDLDQCKIFQFSTCMGNLFKKYLLYRPDWLNIWQNHEKIGNLNDKECWQAELWYEFIKCIDYSSLYDLNISNFHESIIFCLEKFKKKIFVNIPERIFIFGVFGLPPIFYKILQVLKKEINIYLFILNPCRNYINFNTNCDTSIISTNSIFLSNLNNDDIFLSYDNNEKKVDVFFSKSINYYKYYFKQFLFNSWLKPIRSDIFFLLSSSSTSKIESNFENLIDNSLLNFLQRDILEYKENFTVNYCDKDCFLYKNDQRKRFLKFDDDSLSLHGCHSIQREVEVLYDNILSIISNDLSILPHEILVMSSNLDQYIPAIYSVFCNSLKGSIPFVIVDTKLKDIHPILITFLTFLKLPHSRYTSEDLLSLLEISAISARFNFNKIQLKLLRDYIIDSGICWGLDDSTFIDLGLPITSEYTWVSGFDRMLLGYAMDSDSGVWRNIFPYKNLSKDKYIELIGQLGNFLTKLRFWKHQLVLNRKLSEWKCCFREMIADFFYLTEKEEKSFLLLETYLYELLGYKQIIKDDKLISISLIYDYLSNKLEHEWISQKFLSGGINFCKFSSKSFLPFKIIYLLGMNDNIFPRISSEMDLNLMLDDKRFGDYDSYDFDCYLFLEVLLSATKKLYISFIYCSIYDGGKRYYSVLIDKLIEYIAHNFSLQGRENINMMNSIHHMRDHLCKWHSSLSNVISDSYVFIEKTHSVSNNVNFPVFYKQNFFNKDFTYTLNIFSRKLLLIDDLLDFYKSPIKYWFNKVLLINFDSNIVSPVVHEPFIIKGLTKYLLNINLLNCFIKNRGNNNVINDLYHKIGVSGVLPHGSFGKLYWLQQCNIMSELADKIIKWYIPDQFDKNISLMIDNTQIVGLLSSIQVNGLLRWRPRALSIKDGLLLWIEHLIYCAIGGMNDSRLFGINSKWHFPVISVSVAKSYLSFLLHGYYDGLLTPLLLLNKSVDVWLDCCFNRDTKKISLDVSKQCDAKKKLLLAWKGNKYVLGENNDPYLQRLMGINFNSQDIEFIVKIAEQFYLPILQYNIKE